MPTIKSTPRDCVFSIRATRSATSAITVGGEGAWPLSKAGGLFAILMSLMGSVCGSGCCRGRRVHENELMQITLIGGVNSELKVGGRREGKMGSRVESEIWRRIEGGSR